MTKVSVLLPTYNESGNIVPLVKSIIENIPTGYGYEILVIDDNSPDKTYELVSDSFETIQMSSRFSDSLIGGWQILSGKGSRGPPEPKSWSWIPILRMIPQRYLNCSMLPKYTIS